MTIDISNNAARVNYTVAQGVTQTSFSVPFEFFNDADLSVYVDDVLKTITTHYTVSGGDGSTGTITMSVTGASGGSTVVISRSIAIERTSDFVTGVDINRAALNTQLDTLTAIAADNKDKASRSISAPNSEVNPQLELPDADTRKGKLVGFNETTGNVELSATLADGNTLASISGDIATLADIEDGTDATDAIQTVAGISSDVTTVAGISANVTTVAGNASNINTVAGDSTSINTVAGDTTEINAVAGKTTEIGRLGTADAVSDLNTLGTADVVSDMNTLGTSGNVNNMSTLAGISANITTVAGISANVTTVAGDSANISAVAGNSTNINTVAGQTTNLQNVTDNLADIQNASANAIAAAGSASAAAGSASAAAGSATAASDSAAAAAAAFDSFDDKYLGSKTGYAGSGTGPTTDNDGNALVEGALFFSADANEMRVYDGANWIAASSAGSASLILYEFTATSGQTTFSGADDNGATLGYTTGNTQFVLNGVILDPSDVTATNGTSVVLASGAATGDLLNIYAFKSFTVADTVSASAGGTFAGDVSFTANFTSRGIDDNATSTAMTLDTSGNVGIGTSSPTTKLQSKGGSIATLTDNAGLIANASASFVVDHGNDYGLYTGYIAAAGDAIGIAATRTLGSALPLSLQPFGGNLLLGTTVAGRAAEGADRFTIADASHSGMTIRSGVNAYGSINFSDSEGGAGEYAGSIWYGHGTLGEKLVMAIQGSNKVTVDGDGLKFNNDTAAANALDDYEEGTWTPTLGRSSVNPTTTYSRQSGYYIKVGAMVTLFFNMQFGTVSNVGSGTLRINGIPFNTSSDTNMRAAGTFGYNDAIVSTGVENIRIQSTDGANHLLIIAQVLDSTEANNLFSADPTSAKYLQGSITYKTDS